MKRELILLSLVFLIAGLLLGCQGPEAAENFLEEERNYPLVVRELEGAGIPCQGRARSAYLNFPCRNSAVLGFEIKETTPFWGIALRNQGHTELKAELDARSFSVQPGESRWIYTAEAAETGEHLLTVSSESKGPLKGYAELWLAATPEAVCPGYELDGRILQVYDHYLQVEPWHYEGSRNIPDSFYVKLPEGEQSFWENQMLRIFYSGKFSENTPPLLEEVRKLTILGWAAEDPGASRIPTARRNIP